MAYDSNYGACCSTCGSSSGCSCGCGGYDYSSCSPGYNPINTSNSFCPNVEGSTSQGGSATGNNSSVNVSVEASGRDGDDCCCKDGVKKLLDYLYKKSLSIDNPTDSICIYGDIIPSDIINADCIVPPALLYVANTATSNLISTISINNDLVKFGLDRVSLCAISVIKFKFKITTTDTILNDLRTEFYYTPKCNCCCDCGPGMGEALYLHGLGIGYNLIIKDTLLSSSGTLTGLGAINGVTLAAVDSDIAIFYDNTAKVYLGIPTCKIAKFTPIA
ncbi:MAG: hypothetical protein ACRCYC_01195 [Paraclostridium sp.]|uniref:hypothetical protein n=1 Tax=Paraclostridium sp. TaxID=2023273 RepID=UPI003F36F5CB